MRDFKREPASKFGSSFFMLLMQPIVDVAGDGWSRVNSLSLAQICLSLSHNSLSPRKRYNFLRSKFSSLLDRTFPRSSRAAVTRSCPSSVASTPIVWLRFDAPAALDASRRLLSDIHTFGLFSSSRWINSALVPPVDNSLSRRASFNSTTVKSLPWYDGLHTQIHNPTSENYCRRYK